MLLVRCTGVSWASILGVGSVYKVGILLAGRRGAVACWVGVDGAAGLVFAHIWVGRVACMV